MVALVGTFSFAWLIDNASHSAGSAMDWGVIWQGPVSADAIGDGIPVAICSVLLLVCAIRLAFSASHGAAALSVAFGVLCAFTGALVAARLNGLASSSYTAEFTMGAGVWVVGAGGLLATAGGVVGLIERSPAVAVSHVARARAVLVMLPVLSLACLWGYVYGHMSTGGNFATPRVCVTRVVKQAVGNGVPIVLGLALATASLLRTKVLLRRGHSDGEPGRIPVIMSTVCTVILGVVPLILFVATGGASCPID